MPTGHALRLIPPLLLAAISLVASPTSAQTFVNVSKTKSDSGSQRMAVAGSNVYVVWVEDQGSYRPMFSRSTNSGQTFSTAVQVLSGNGTVSPDIAATGTNVYIARSARPSPKSPSQVHFMRSIDDGATFGSQIQVSKASVNGAFFNALAVNGSNVYIVWNQWVGKWEVFFARSDNNGASFKDPVQLSNTSSSNPLGVVKLVADGDDVHVAWSEDFGGGKSAIYYTRSMDGGKTFNDGVPIGDPIKMSNDDTSTNVFPALAVSGSSVYLAWMEHAACAQFSCQPGEAQLHIFFRRSDDSGMSFRPVEDLSDITSDTRGVAGGPQLAAFGPDVVHVIWHANPGGGNYDVFYRGSIDRGASFGTPRDISCDLSSCAGALNSPTGVIAANRANVYISWSGGASTARDIYMAHSGDSGATFGTPKINVSSTTPADSGSPQLVATPTEVHVTWGDHTPGNWDVFYWHGTP